MAYFTASSIERICACPASAALPQVLDSNEDGQRGVAIHAYVERHLRGVDPTKALALVPDPTWRDTCAKIDVHRLVSGMVDVIPERAYAVDVFGDTAVDLGSGIGRRYPETAAHVVCGTTDIRGTVAMLDIPRVLDLKTGFREVAAAEENMQVMFAARAEQLLTGADAVEGGIGYVKPNGYVKSDMHTFTRFDLDGFPDVVADAVRRVDVAKKTLADGGMPDLKTGDHCTYCPAMPACNAHVGLVRRAMIELGDLESRILALTPEQGGAAVLKVKAIKRLAKRLEDGLNAFADRIPLPTTPGKVYKAIGIRKSYFKKDRAIHIMLAHGATQAEVDSCFDEVVESQHREVNLR